METTETTKSPLHFKVFKICSKGLKYAFRFVVRMRDTLEWVEFEAYYSLVIKGIFLFFEKYNFSSAYPFQMNSEQSSCALFCLLSEQQLEMGTAKKNNEEE